MITLLEEKGIIWKNIILCQDATMQHRIIVSRRFQTFFIAKEMGASPVQYRKQSKDARQEN